MGRRLGSLSPADGFAASLDVVTDVVQQRTTTLLAAACPIVGIVLLVADTGPYMLPTLRLHTFLGATLFSFGFVLAARALVLAFRRTAPR